MKKWIQAIKLFFWALNHEKEARQLLVHDKAPPESEPKTESSHLRLLTMLQHSGRLVDFFKEDLSQHSDADIGSVVRKIHQDCSTVLEENITIRSLLLEEEGTLITVQPQYDPTVINIVGSVKGSPPYKAKVIHKGWKAEKRSLPKQIAKYSVSDVLYPAQVEISNSK